MAGPALQPAVAEATPGGRSSASMSDFGSPLPPDLEEDHEAGVLPETPRGAEEELVRTSTIYPEDEEHRALSPRSEGSGELQRTLTMTDSAGSAGAQPERPTCVPNSLARAGGCKRSPREREPLAEGAPAEDGDGEAERSPLMLMPEDSGSLEGSYAHLCKLSLPAMANQASRPLAALILVGLVGNAPGGDSAELLAAFAAVVTTVTFATALCNFLLTVTWAQLGKVAIGQQRWGEVGPRVRTASAVAAGCGVACALILYCLKGALFAGMALTPEVEALATPFYYWRLATLPLLFLHSTACGVLGGYQRIHAVTLVSCCVAAAEVATAYVALYALDTLDGGLEALGLAHFLTAAGGLVAAAWTAMALPPAEAKGAITLVPTSLSSCGGRADADYADLNGAMPELDDEEEDYADLNGATPELDDEEEDTEEEPPSGAAREFLCAGKDQMIRSLALQASVYAMAVCASQLGTAPLAAHQVVMALWMLSAYVCDGFADIGTMLGSAKYGAGEDIGDLSVKLITMGAACGGLCGLILWCFSGGVMACFTSHSDVLAQLESVWWLLCIMQPSNGAVFVLDGLLLALQAFSFAAKAMIGSVCLAFVPVLLIGLLGSNTLAAIWTAKCALNLARLVSAGVFVYTHYDPAEDPAWLEAAVEVGRGSLDLDDEEAGLMLAAAADDDAQKAAGAGSPHQELVDREAARRRAVQAAQQAEQATHAEMDAELAEVHAKIGALSPQPVAARGYV